MDAYFIAVNVSGTIEQSLQMVLAGFVNACFRNPVSSWFTFMGNFVMLGWVCSSWALLFCVVVPQKNVVLVTALFHALMGLIFGGGLAPYTFDKIYESSRLNFVSAFFAPARYFIESLPVSDFKCLPDQTGFTQTQEATDFPREFQSFLVRGPGTLDKNIGDQTCRGWFWAWPAMFTIGLTIRLYAHAFLYLVERSKKNKPPLSTQCLSSFSLNWRIGFLLVLLVLMQVTSILLIVLER